MGTSAGYSPRRNGSVSPAGENGHVSGRGVEPLIDRRPTLMPILTSFLIIATSNGPMQRNDAHLERFCRFALSATANLRTNDRGHLISHAVLQRVSLCP